MSFGIWIFRIIVKAFLHVVFIVPLAPKTPNAPLLDKSLTICPELISIKKNFLFDTTEYDLTSLVYGVDIIMSGMLYR